MRLRRAINGLNGFVDSDSAPENAFSAKKSRTMEGPQSPQEEPCIVDSKWLQESKSNSGLVESFSSLRVAF